ncbi:MAG: hydrogenase maturation nickel metallochaperone HypA/HybF [Actinomycetota bacterium]
MHELSLTSAIQATVEKHAAGRQVTVVNVLVGKLRQVVPDSLSFYWGVVTRGTLIEGAELNLQIVPALLRCDGCENEWEPDFPTFRCPFCVTGQVKVLSGEEFLVDSIEVEEDEHASHQG